MLRENTITLNFEITSMTQRFLEYVNPPSFRQIKELSIEDIKLKKTVT